MVATAASMSSGMPASRAKWFSVPVGITPKVAPCSIATAAAVETVPSPPAATMARRRCTARSAAARTSSPRTRSTVASSPARDSAPSRSASGGAPLPDPSLTMTVTGGAVTLAVRIVRAPTAARLRAAGRACRHPADDRGELFDGHAREAAARQREARRDLRSGDAERHADSDVAEVDHTRPIDGERLRTGVYGQAVGEWNQLIERHRPPPDRLHGSNNPRPPPARPAASRGMLTAALAGRST